MPSSTVNICVLTLVLLSFQQICHCKPHENKRAIVKDYYVPDTLVFPSEQFEKGDDGKYYLKKDAHRQDSEVNYISAENAEKKIVSGDSETEIIKNDSKTPETSTIKTGQYQKELSVKESEHVPSLKTAKEPKKIGEKIDIMEKKAPFTPIDPKFIIRSKPNGKDEEALKMDPPTTKSEEKEEEKISIGQVPQLSPEQAPGNFRIPILIPIRHIAYRTMKIIPVPPVDVSDRLPIPYEDDIVGEGAHESESEEVSQPLAEKESGHYLGNPLMFLHSFHDVLKNLKEADKGDVEKETKVVDVLGKKLLMQSNVMKYPASDNSRVFIRFLSVKPFEEPKEVVPEETPVKKEIEAEEEKIITEIKKEESLAKQNDNMEKDEIESKIEKENEEKITEEADILKADETEEKQAKEAEILKAEETELKVNIEKNVPKEIIVRHMDEEETDEDIENVEKEAESVEVMEETNMPQPKVKDVDLNPFLENEEMEKVGSQNADEKINDETIKNNDGTYRKLINDGKGNIKKAVESSMKKDEEKKNEYGFKERHICTRKEKKKKNLRRKVKKLSKERRMRRRRGRNANVKKKIAIQMMKATSDVAY